ncbi:MAG: DUF488 family protein [Labilithrix sp.]|nr:DUF488 family protein [Labilithrix sp.]
MLQIKRAYEAPSPTDGTRILVDRLWPRGLKKQDARLDAWLAELAPSDELRRWFGHEPSRFAEFRRRYLRELARTKSRALVEEVARRAAEGVVTLLFAAKDTQHNNAVVLAAAVEHVARQCTAVVERSPALRRGRGRSVPVDDATLRRSREPDHVPPRRSRGADRAPSRRSREPDRPMSPRPTRAARTPPRRSRVRA